MSKQLWVIDPVHSEIVFKVRHVMITNVSGTFDRFEAKMYSSEKDFSDAEISFEADVESVNTRNEQRDGHLKSGDFFEVEKFPKLTFKSTSFKSLGNNKYALTGDFSLKGVNKNVDFGHGIYGFCYRSMGSGKGRF